MKRLPPEERERNRAASQVKYTQTIKGRAATDRARAKYNQSDKGKATRAAWSQSPKGKAASARGREKQRYELDKAVAQEQARIRKEQAIAAASPDEKWITLLLFDGTTRTIANPNYDPAEPEGD